MHNPSTCGFLSVLGTLPENGSHAAHNSFKLQNALFILPEKDIRSMPDYNDIPPAHGREPFPFSAEAGKQRRARMIPGVVSSMVRLPASL